MKKILSMLALALCALGLQAVDVNVIPRPAKMQMSEGTMTPTAKNTKYVIDKKVAGPEAYTLTITPKGVRATASTEAGLFYARQTLEQLKGADGTVPCLTIEDSPRFEYRGVMIDPCRHFQTLATLKKQVDLMARFKLNRLHLHLTDDQGWRIEIKRYPELTAKGAVRTEGDGSTHRGYYTQEEMRDLVAYAAERHIEVIPELEMPGHELCAIAAFPNLSCRGEQVTPRAVWGVEDIVMCPGKEDMFTFLQNVIDELVPLFPSPLFHIGGDESPRREWRECPLCQQRMKAEGLTTEAQLQSYIIGRMEKYLNQKGKTIIGWDEILEGGNLNQSAIVMSWRGEEGGKTAAKAGHKVLMTPSSRGLYFDTYQGEPLVEQSECIWGPCTLEQVYNYDPVPDSLSYMQPYVLGVQGNVWHEYIHNQQELEQRLWPRALALSEIAWSPVEGKNFEDFQHRVEMSALPLLDRLGYGYHIPVPETVGGSCDKLVFVKSRELKLRSTRPERIVYTLDGTEPTAKSPVYVTPLNITRTCVVKTACVLPSGKVGPVRTIQLRQVEGYQNGPACCNGQKCEQPNSQKAGKGGKQTADKCAAQPCEQKGGLRVNMYWGNYRNTATIQEGMADSTFQVAGLSELPHLSPMPHESVRGVRNYAAVAEGCFEVPTDGVYEFRSANTEVWVDGELLVDNGSSLLQRHSRFNAEAALSAGVHRVKVVFLGGVFRGWPTYWDDGSVSLRRTDGKPGKWQGIELK